MTNYQLRVKVQEAVLYRNVSKYGSMSPFTELTWNTQSWTSTVASNQHKSPKWDDYHLFSSSDAAPLILRILHYSILFKPQEIGFCTISTNDLFKGKSKDWVEVYFEGKIVGKIKLSLNMYEEKKSDQSTLNTSYSAVDLKEEYLRKLNELELEKEELEFYRRKYKKKQQRMAQERRNYGNAIKECVVKLTPPVTEESDEDEIGGKWTSKREGCDEGNRGGYKSLGSQACFDMIKMRNTRMGTLTAQEYENEGRKGPKGIRTYLSGDFERTENSEGTLELKFEGLNQFSTPGRALNEVSKKPSLDSENP